MHVVRQDDPGIDMKGVSFPGGPHRLAEKVDVTDKKIASAVTQIDREEIGRTRHLGTAVSRHAAHP